MSSTEENNYTSLLMKNVANKSELCDYILVADKDKQKFPIHSLIMRAASPYFDALFGPNFCDGKQKEITLRDIDGPTLKLIIDFVYHGRITITEKNVDDVIAAASSMELVEIEMTCSDFWAKTLNAKNYVDTLLKAIKFHLNDLEGYVVDVIIVRFCEIDIREISKIDEKIFNELLEDEILGGPESNIFDRVVGWLDADRIGRAEYTSDLLKLIRLQHIPLEFLVENVEPFFTQHNQMELIVNEYRRRLLHPSAEFTPRCVAHLEKTLCCFCPQYSRDGNIICRLK